MVDTSKLNTTIDFTLCDGSTVKMTLAFYAIYKLKNSNRAMYDKYNRAINNMAKKQSEELDSITILYVAYYCANAEKNAEKLMSEEEFIMMCGSDRKAVTDAAKALMEPKGNTGFGRRS